MLLAHDLEVPCRRLVILVAADAIESENYLSTLVGEQYLSGQIDDDLFRPVILPCHLSFSDDERRSLDTACQMLCMLIAAMPCGACLY
jgi:hypothetical protein